MIDDIKGYHQTVHLFGGFIFVPSGQRNASANACEFIIIPFTLKMYLIIISHFNQTKSNLIRK